MVERHPYKVDVAGSNPVLPTIRTTEITVVFYFWGWGTGKRLERNGKKVEIKNAIQKYYY